MRLTGFGILILSAILMIAPAVSGADPRQSPGEMFDLGTEAFAGGRYEEALDYFRAAGRAGMDTPALHYNLGVTYYKLERYGPAEAAFERLADIPEAEALARYNLGRIALARGNEAEARRHFQAALRTAGDDRLRMLAEDRLAELPVVEAPRKWLGFVSLAAGYDDNVALIADSEVLIGEEKDGFVEFIGGATGQLLGTPADGLQLKTTGYYQKYIDASEYDFGNLRIGPEIDRSFGGWKTSLGGFADISYIDQDLFEKIFTAEARGVREIYPNLSLGLKYQLSVIDAESPYDDLSGSRHRMSADLRTVFFGAYTGLGYTLELNDRDDPDYPTRHSVGFLLDRDLTDAWAAGLTGSYRYSDYRETGREDDRIWISARISRRIFGEFRAFGKYDYIRNDSNIDENEYTSNQYFVGIERFF